MTRDKNGGNDLLYTLTCRYRDVEHYSLSRRTHPGQKPGQSKNSRLKTPKTEYLATSMMLVAMNVHSYTYATTLEGQRHANEQGYVMIRRRRGWYVTRVWEQLGDKGLEFAIFDLRVLVLLAHYFVLEEKEAGEKMG